MLKHVTNDIHGHVPYTQPKTARILAVFSYPARPFLVSSYPCFLGFLFFGVTEIIHPFEISYRWKCLPRKSKPLLVRPTNVLLGCWLTRKGTKHWFTTRTAIAYAASRPIRRMIENYETAHP